jgi:hypothetical protein
VKTLTKCSFATLFLSLLLSYADIRSSDSKFDIFEQLRLGMPESELIELFRASGVQCHPGDARGGSYAASTYDFSDYAREYHVSVDARTNKVSLMTFGFKRRSYGLPRLFGRTH